MKEVIEQGDENLNQKQKDLDELYKLLHERENQVKEVNDYAQALLEDKKKMMDQVELKDREIERLG